MNAEVEGFAQFVEGRQRALQRTAWLLTGDWALADLGHPTLATAVQRRTSTIETDFPARMISMFPHLTGTEHASARLHLGPGPLLAAPIEDRDALLGVLFAWGPSVVLQRNLVETLAALAGFAWRSRHPAPSSGGAVSGLL